MQLHNIGRKKYLGAFLLFCFMASPAIQNRRTAGVITNDETEGSEHGLTAYYYGAGQDVLSNTTKNFGEDSRYTGWSPNSYFPNKCLQRYRYINHIDILLCKNMLHIDEGVYVLDSSQYDTCGWFIWLSEGPLLSQNKICSMNSDSFISNLSDDRSTTSSKTIPPLNAI